MAQVSDYYIIDGLKDSRDAYELKSQLSRLAGVKSVSVNHALSRLTVDYDTTGVDRQRIERTAAEVGCSLMRDSGDNQLS